MNENLFNVKTIVLNSTI